MTERDQSLAPRLPRKRAIRLEASIAAATKALCALQRPDGHFVFELEADATIPAEYVLMRALSRRAGRRRARSEDRALSPAHSIGTMAAGRCFTPAHPTSAPASKPISR